MDLCGHATLAAAHVIFTYYETDASKLTFHSEFSGQLGAERVPASAIDGPLLIQMRLPCRPPVKVEDTTKMPGEIITGKPMT